MKLRLDMTCREKALIEERLRAVTDPDEIPAAHRVLAKLTAAWQGAATKSNARR